LQLLDQQGEVSALDVGAEGACGCGALEEPLRGLIGLAACAVQVLGGGEGSGEARWKGMEHFVPSDVPSAHDRERSHGG
jgi:hypothetical protein